VALIGEAALCGDLGERSVAEREELSRSRRPKMPSVLADRAADVTGKRPAQIHRVHIEGRRNASQRPPIREMRLEKLQCGGHAARAKSGALHVERATKESPFGGPIAHGYLTLSLAASLSIDAGVIPSDAAAALNYGLDKVRFIAPVKAGARVRNRVVLVAVDDKGEGRRLLTLRNTIEIDGEERPALIAESLAMLMAGPAA